MGDRLPVPQHNVVFGEQPQAPAPPTARWRATGEGDQVRFLFAIHFRCGAGRGRVPLYRRDALGAEPLAHPRDGGATDIEGGGDLAVGPGGTAGGFIRFEQDARPREGAGGSGSLRDEGLQRRAIASEMSGFRYDEQSADRLSPGGVS